MKQTVCCKHPSQFIDLIFKVLGKAMSMIHDDWVYVFPKHVCFHDLGDSYETSDLLILNTKRCIRCKVWKDTSLELVTILALHIHLAPPCLWLYTVAHG